MKPSDIRKARGLEPLVRPLEKPALDRTTDINLPSLKHTQSNSGYDSPAGLRHVPHLRTVTPDNPLQISRLSCGTMPQLFENSFTSLQQRQQGSQQETVVETPETTHSPQVIDKILTLGVSVPSGSILATLDRNGDGQLSLLDLFPRKDEPEIDCPTSRSSESILPASCSSLSITLDNSDNTSSKLTVSPRTVKSSSAEDSPKTTSSLPDSRSTNEQKSVSSLQTAPCSNLEFTSDALQALQDFQTAFATRDQCPSNRASVRQPMTARKHDPMKSTPRSELTPKQYWGRARQSFTNGEFHRNGIDLPTAMKLPPGPRRHEILPVSPQQNKTPFTSGVTVSATEVLQHSERTPRTHITKAPHSTAIQARPLQFETIGSMDCVDNCGNSTDRTRISMLDRSSLTRTDSKHAPCSKLVEFEYHSNASLTKTLSKDTKTGKYRHTSRALSRRRSHLVDDDAEDVSSMPPSHFHQKQANRVTDTKAPVVEHQPNQGKKTARRATPRFTEIAARKCEESQSSSGEQEEDTDKNDDSQLKRSRSSSGSSCPPSESTSIEDNHCRDVSAPEEDCYNYESPRPKHEYEGVDEDSLLDGYCTETTTGVGERQYSLKHTTGFSNSQETVDSSIVEGVQGLQGLRTKQTAMQRTSYVPVDSRKSFRMIRNAKVPLLKLDGSMTPTDSSRSNYSLSQNLFDKLHDDQLNVASELAYDEPHLTLDQVILEPEELHKPQQYARINIFVHTLDCEASGVVRWEEKANAVIRLSSSEPYFRATAGWYGLSDILDVGLKGPLFPIISVRYHRLVETPGGSTVTILLRAIGLFKQKVDLILVCRCDPISKSVTAILAVEIRQRDATTYLVQRRVQEQSLSLKKRSAVKLPTLMFTPSLFRNVTQPAFNRYGMYGSNKSRVLQAWRHLSRVTDRDWVSYMKLRDSYVEGYREVMALSTRQF